MSDDPKKDIEIMPLISKENRPHLEETSNDDKPDPKLSVGKLTLKLNSLG
jgi:hypothetical protein